MLENIQDKIKSEKTMTEKNKEELGNKLERSDMGGIEKDQILKIIEDGWLQSKQTGRIEAELGKQSESQTQLLLMLNIGATLAIGGILYMVHFA